jgi:hypothetical protein
MGYGVWDWDCPRNACHELEHLEGYLPLTLAHFFS